MPVTTLNTILNWRDGGIHRYWRVGTTEGDTGESHWTEMRDGGFVSIGWSEQVPALTEVIGQEKAAAESDKGVASPRVSEQRRRGIAQGRRDR